ncbi:hypothetical protein ALQ55_200099 [Pseudomonas savastanoi pv. savastanoi]|nr:hypothetical protein ALQ55_200099 [Pseudomonas savastanoi pv. savastanoi]
MLLRLEDIQLALHVLCGGFIAVSQHILQARDPQIGQVVTQLSDVADSVGAIDEFIEAGPANQGENGSEKKNRPKAQCQLHVDADIRKAAVHKIS